jgi:hypothetical protein
MHDSVNERTEIDLVPPRKFGDLDRIQETLMEIIRIMPLSEQEENVERNIVRDLNLVLTFHR